MWSKIKPELTAAIAVSAGLLLAAGYLFVWAQLGNANLPVQPILSALPTTFFVTSALQSLAVPLVVLLTLVAVVLAFSGGETFPSWKWWLVFGVALAFVARIVALADVRLVAGWNSKTTIFSSVVAAGVIGLSAFVGSAGGRLLPAAADAGRKLQAKAAVMLVLTIVAASAFRVADAWTVDRPLPYVGVFLDTEDCPPVFDVNRQPFVSMVTPEGNVDPPPKPARVQEKRCFVAGLYVGESDQWMFVAEPPNEKRRAPGRLILLPRDAAQLGATANSPLTPAVTADKNR